MRGERIDDYDEKKRAILEKVEGIAEEIDKYNLGRYKYDEYVEEHDEYFFDKFPFDDNGFPHADNWVRYYFGSFKRLRAESDKLEE